jgi:hypothetical protein
MPLFRPARGRRRPVKRARTPTDRPPAPPVKPHDFVATGVYDHRGVETCGWCQLLADRTDVHPGPGAYSTVDQDVAAISRRIVGERDDS